MNGKTAIIIGATGLTGSLLLDLLIADKNYTTIKLFSRRFCKQNSPKIKEFIGDIVNLEQFENDFIGDVVFCCVGTTKAKTKDNSIYEKIDLGIPVKAASLAKVNNIGTFLVISALGADTKSRLFYNSLKGRMEEDVLAQFLPNTYVMRPSLINGDRAEKRLGEGIASVILALLNPLLFGNLKKYKAIKAKDIAKAMHHLAQTTPELCILESDQIQLLSNFKV